MGENTTYINLDTRTLYINGEITTAEVSYIIFNLIHMIQEDDLAEETIVDYEREPIHIYMTSVGGEVYAMWALVDIMLKSKTPIWTYSLGNTDSAALKIFLAGSRRFCYTHSCFLYHQLSAGISGTFTTMNDKVIDDYAIAQAQIEDYVVRRTKIDAKSLEEIRECNRDWIIRPAEALEYGIVTDIIEVFDDDEEEKDTKVKKTK